MRPCTVLSRCLVGKGGRLKRVLHGARRRILPTPHAAGEYMERGARGWVGWRRGHRGDEEEVSGREAKGRRMKGSGHAYDDARPRCMLEACARVPRPLRSYTSLSGEKTTFRGGNLSSTFDRTWRRSSCTNRCTMGVGSALPQRRGNLQATFSPRRIGLRSSSARPMREISRSREELKEKTNGTAAETLTGAYYDFTLY